MSKMRLNETKVPVEHTGIDVHRGNRAIGAVGSVGARSLKRTRIRSKRGTRSQKIGDVPCLWRTQEPHLASLEGT